MDALQILIKIASAMFQLLPAVEQYGPQIIDDLKQDWETFMLIYQNGGVPTQEQHDAVLSNLERAHTLFQANTADVDDILINP